MPSLSSSDGVWPDTARAIAGSGHSIGAWRTGLSFGASVSPVWVFANFGTATMSPAMASATGSWVAPRIAISPCRCSGEPLAVLTRWALGVSVPDSTRHTEI